MKSEVASPGTHPAGDAEGTGGGVVSVLSSPPPPSYSDNHPLSHAQICLALDEVLDWQWRHDRTRKRLRTLWVVAVSVLAASHLALWALAVFRG